MGLFNSLQIAKQGLSASQTGLEVTGHNLANANTVGYTKQRVNVASVPLNQSSVGGGVQVQAIERLADQFLINSIRDQGSNLQSLSEQRDIIERVEQILNEFGDSDLSSGFSEFFEAAQTLSDNPEDQALREAFLQVADKLAFRLNTIGTDLEQLQKDINSDIEGAVSEINSLSATIASLNVNIVQSEADGTNANDLRDQRDEAVRKLAEIAKVTSNEQADGSIIVNITGDNLIQGGDFNTLTVSKTVVNGKPISTPIFQNNLAPLVLQNGQLKGLIEGRDTLAGGTLADLDNLANTFANAVNAIQTTGFGLTGYSELTSLERVTNTDVALNQAGYSRSVQNGSFTIQVRNSQTDVVTPVTIQVDADGIGFDTTLDSLRNEINAELTAKGITDISASINAENQLSLTSNASNLTFSFTDDTSNVLNVLDLGTLFTGTGASGLAVNSVLQNNTDFLAAGTSTNPADNSNALKIVQLRDQEILSGQTAEEFNQSIVINVGTTAAKLTDSALNQELLFESLTNEQLAKSGVDPDQEFITLVEFQRTFEAIARFTSVLDDLFETLINVV